MLPGVWLPYCAMPSSSLTSSSLGTLNKDEGDAEDDTKSKMYIHLSSEICNSLDLFSTPMAVKSAQAKYAMTAFNSKWKDEKLDAFVVCFSHYMEHAHFMSLFCREQPRNVQQMCTAIVFLVNPFVW